MKHLKTFNQLNESIFSRLFRRNRQEEVVEEPEPEVDSDLANLSNELQEMFMNLHHNAYNWADIEEFAHYCYGDYRDKPEVLRKISYLIPPIPAAVFIGELEKQGIKVTP